MVNLTIRLSKGSGGGAAEGGSGDGSTPGGSEPTVTVSCPNHLVLADLPVAKGLGSVSDVTVVKILGRKARRRLGDKVHFCVRCDFPIAIYGRLDPCEHIFCLTCARRDPNCYLCGERILRIQRMEVVDGIFICGAPRCLRSFVKRQDFQLHIKDVHADLIEPKDDKEDMRHEASSLKAVPAEPQVHAQILTHSPSSSLLVPPQEQRVGIAQPQQSENQSSKAQPKSAVSVSTGEENQNKQNQTKASSGTKQSEQEIYQKQRQSHEERPRRQRQEKNQQEEMHVEEQAQPDLQQTPELPQPPRQQGPMPVSQPGIPFSSFTPQPFPPPYPMHPEGHGFQTPPYPPYHIPHGGYLPPAAPPPPPGPPPSMAPPLLMPPPPPKREKFEPGILPTGEPQLDPHGYLWSAAKPNFGSNWNHGGWPRS